MSVNFYTDETITGHIFLEPSIWVAKRYRCVFSPLEQKNPKVEVIHRIGLFLILPILGALSLLFIPVGLVVKGTSRFFWPPPPNVRLSQTPALESPEGEPIESPKPVNPQEGDVSENSSPHKSPPPSPFDELRLSDLKEVEEDESQVGDSEEVDDDEAIVFGSPTPVQSETDETLSPSSDSTVDSFHTAKDGLNTPSSRRSSVGWLSPVEE